MKNIFVLLLFVTSFIIYSQSKETEEIKIKVFGNCNLCKSRIEKAVSIPEVKFANWNKNTKSLRLIFEKSITIDSLEQRIALAGHDTERYKAPDSVYKQLPKCCLYRENPKTH